MSTRLPSPASEEEPHEQLSANNLELDAWGEIGDSLRNDKEGNMENEEEFDIYLSLQKYSTLYQLALEKGCTVEELVTNQISHIIKPS